MNSCPKIITALLVLVITTLVFSGCVSSSKMNAPAPIITQQTSQETHLALPVTSNESYWIRVDPINEFDTNHSPNQSAIIQFNITGTTNLPVPTIIRIDAYRYMLNPCTGETILEPELLDTAVRVGFGPNSSNIFSTTVIRGDYPRRFPLPPGTYRVTAFNPYENISGTTEFTILPADDQKGPARWTCINPIGKHSLGDTFSIAGVTNVIQAEQVVVNIQYIIHSTPTCYPELQRNPGYSCGENCTYPAFLTAPLINHANGTRTFSFFVNTSGWCHERYRISADIKGWTNVTTFENIFPLYDH